MTKTKEPILLAWGGGKDSLMALLKLRQSKDFEVVGLVSCLSRDLGRMVLRDVGQDLIERQARSLGLPLFLAPGGGLPCFRSLTESLAQGVCQFGPKGIGKVAFGDLFLDEIRDAREERLETYGLEAIFPLWQCDTAELALLFVEERYQALVTTVERTCLSSDFVGRPFDRDFINDLPIVVDPCGENGEFHTFVFDGPLFKFPLRLQPGSIHSTGQFHYCDLTPASQALPHRAVASK